MEDERLPADGRVPIHVLTGFLGSGKTTLLRHLLAEPDLADTAVVINEFGEVGLDHLLVREVAEDVVLLSSGCLCCSVRDDLVSTLAELHALMRTGEIPAFARVVVETTGLADPAPIMQAILSETTLVRWFRLGQVITTVDAVNGEQTLARHREARQQLAMADRLILSKTDLVGESEADALGDKLRAMNPSASLLFSRKAQLPAAEILKEADGQWRAAAAPQLGPVFDRADGTPAMPSAQGHDDAIKSFTVSLPQPVEWPAFVEWLQLLLAARGDSILRVKGLLAVNDDSRPVVVQGVQHVLYPIERLPAWPGASAGPGWIVFIARDLTQQAIENSIRSVYETSLA
ncbi:putative GTP-binding protein YjiA [Variovorax sp. PBL-H6]|uniref:CobW family GTP-binding protein n=1 Tax=Variovorax sp. PBL-H6 TaxID=434009 RepID=UPI0013192443|nr:GTP-binding protein [Variovorax sp. PBL-H6]VTU16293.1 putative GTP-binding protein YjiA [Variovorax sp. PBL-H6]